LRIENFEWDESNILHLELKHGVSQEEAEEVFALSPLFRRTRKGHYAAFGRSLSGRLLVVIFEIKKSGIARIITAWDMRRKEKRYYQKCRKG